MKKKIALACLCGVAVLASQGVMASSLKLRGGITNNSYTLDSTPATGSPYTYATSSFSGTALGLTWLMTDSTYLDFATSSGTGTWTPSTGGDTPNFSRSDNAIVLGSNSMGSSGIASNFYIGWKNGESKLSESINWWGTKFNTSGLVFGGGWGIPAGGGAVMLSLGMGVMSGQYDVIKTTSTTTTKADNTFGFSYGIGYTYPFTPNFGLTVDYKANAYKYKFDSGLSTEWSLDEKLNTSSASLYLMF
jgi:hypothetical protein